MLSILAILPALCAVLARIQSFRMAERTLCILSLALFAVESFGTSASFEWFSDEISRWTSSRRTFRTFLLLCALRGLGNIAITVCYSYKWLDFLSSIEASEVSYIEFLY